jgi:hypothetical protein
MPDDMRERLHRLPAEALEGDVVPQERGEFIEFVEGTAHHHLRVKVTRGFALAGVFLCTGAVWLLLALPGRSVGQLISAVVCALLGLWCLATFQRLGSTPPPRLRYFRLHVDKERFIPCEHSGVPRSMDRPDVRAFLYYRETHKATTWHTAHYHTYEADDRCGIPEAPRHHRYRHHYVPFPMHIECHTERAYLVTARGPAYPLFREEPDRRTGINAVKALGELTGLPALYLETGMLSDRLARHAHEGRFTEEVLERAEEIKGWEK